MRPKADFIAQQIIKTSTGARAYNPGDDVTAAAVENLGLVIGEQVLPANVHVIPRPAGNAKRADWEAYWLGQGLDREEVDGMTRDQMADRDPVFDVPDDVNDAVNINPNPQPVTVPLPHSNATKAEWVEYAVARGMPRDAANDSTIKQLADADYDTLFGKQA